MVSLCHQPDWVQGPHRNTPLGVSKRMLQRDLTAERSQTMGGTIPCLTKVCVGGLIPQAEVQDYELVESELHTSSRLSAA